MDYYEPDAPSCRLGYFLCNDTRLCIAQKLNCDSEANCYDGSDEWNCSDSAANLFWDSFYRKDIKAITDDIPWGTCREYLEETIAAEQRLPKSDRLFRFQFRRLSPAELHVSMQIIRDPLSIQGLCRNPSASARCEHNALGLERKPVPATQPNLPLRIALRREDVMLVNEV